MVARGGVAAQAVGSDLVRGDVGERGEAQGLGVVDLVGNARRVSVVTSAEVMVILSVIARGKAKPI